MQLKNESYRQLVSIVGFAIPLVNIISVHDRKPVVDIAEFDKLLSVKDIYYNCEACTYNGEKCSKYQYLLLKFGESAVKLLDELS